MILFIILTIIGQNYHIFCSEKFVFSDSQERLAVLEGIYVEHRGKIYMSAADNMVYILVKFPDTLDQQLDLHFEFKNNLAHLQYANTKNLLLFRSL